MYKYGTTFKVSPETVDTTVSTACFQINGTSTDPIDTPQTVLPDLSGFKVMMPLFNTVGAVCANSTYKGLWVRSWGHIFFGCSKITMTPRF